MGILDTIMNELPQEHAGAGNGGVPAMLTGLLEGGQGGGLGGLAEKFKSAGLGHVFDSWAGNGANQPVAPEDVHRALGEDQVRGMAAQTGMSTGQLLPMLAQFLPKIVDRLTPQGQIPDRNQTGAQA
jgi:uncharacterized protein YidB (DUF937 family)